MRSHPERHRRVGCFEETNETTDLEFPAGWIRTGRSTSPNTGIRFRTWITTPIPRTPSLRACHWACHGWGLPRRLFRPLSMWSFFMGAGPSNQFRIIPIDGRGHDPVRAKDISYFGDAVGHWDGDTLVVESVGFNDESWLASGGYFHSYDMKVTERLRREGNILHYQATVEDPTVLLQPWVMNARELDLNPDPKAYVQEGDQCSQPDPGLVVSRVRH